MPSGLTPSHASEVPIAEMISDLSLPAKAGMVV